MDKLTEKKYNRILSLAEQDELYRQFYSEWEESEEQLLDWEETLSREQVRDIAQYSLLLVAMNRRLLEIACEKMDFMDE